MGNLAVHMRITNIQVTNEDVDTRQAAVSELVETWGKLKQPKDIIQKASEIAHALGGDGVPPPTLAQEVEGAIQKRASAFLCTEGPLEVGICSGVAVSDLLSPAPGNGGWTTPDVFAAALWSAIDFQCQLMEPKREVLRTEVLNLARSRSIAAAESARQRSEVGDFGELTIALDEESKATSNFKKATQATVAALRRNAALDREELDFLWWAQLGRIRSLDRPLGKVHEPIRLVAAGIEAAGLLRRLPCDVHRDLVLRTVDKDPTLDLEGILVAIGDDREALVGRYGSGIVAQAPGVFPLLHGLVTGSASGDSAKLPHPSSYWGSRALLEAGLAQMCTTGPGVL